MHRHSQCPPPQDRIFQYPHPGNRVDFLLIGAGHNHIASFSRLHEVPIRQPSRQAAFNLSDEIVVEIGPEAARFDIGIHAWKR